MESAREFENRRDFRSAIGVYLDILKRHGGNSKIYNNLGADYFETGEYGKAIEALKKSISLSPNSKKTRFNLGVAYSYTNKYPEAIVELRAALKIDGEYIPARRKLCETLLASGANGNAERCYRNLLKRLPDSVRDHSNLGTALMRLGRFADAERVYLNLLDKFGEDFEVFNNLGVVLLQWHKYESAVSALSRAISLAPNNPSARFNLAVAQIALKNRREALEQYSFLKLRQPELARKLFERLFSSRMIKVGGG